MSMTLTPCNGPMVPFAPDARFSTAPLSRA
jgi:hypothetical protein